MRNTVNGRFATEDTWPQGGMVTKRLDDRNFDVQVLTGYPTSTVRQGQWNRGVLMRFDSPAFRPPRENLTMYDPTDPQTWQE